MASLGSIGRNSRVASLSVSYTQYGPAVASAVPSNTFHSTIPRNSTPVSLSEGNPQFWSPASEATVVSGVTQVSGVDTGGLEVLLFDDKGILLGKTISDGAGLFSIIAMGRTSTFVVGFNSPTYNALIFSEVVPV